MTTEELVEMIAAAKSTAYRYHLSAEGKLSALQTELRQTQKMIQKILPAIVHELLEFLRHQDIQALDEEEFAQKVSALLSGDSASLPF